MSERHRANLFKDALLLAVARLLTDDLLASLSQRPGGDTRFAREAGQTQQRLVSEQLLVKDQELGRAQRPRAFFMC